MSESNKQNAEDGASGVLVIGPFPSPGSGAAIELDCVCPEEINGWGHGNTQLSGMNMGQRWVYSIKCPLHLIDEKLDVSGVEGQPGWLVLTNPSA